MLSRAFGAQLRAPHGVCASLIGAFMNRHNRSMIDSTLELLAPRVNESVMDLGFGGGRSLDLLLKTAPGVRVTGVEPSPAMLMRAKRRFQSSLQSGALQLSAGTADCLSLPSQSFDAVCSINTIYFWPDLTRGFIEIARVMRPQGRIALGYRPPEVMRRLAFTRQGFKLYDEPQLTESLSHAGIHVLRRMRGEDALGYCCLLAQCRP